MAYPPPQPQGYPPQQGGYPPQQGGYPPQQGGYPPQQGGYPPQQGGYPPQQGGYAPPQHGSYPPQQGGQPGYGGGYPPPGAPGFNQAAQPDPCRQWFDAVDQDRSGKIDARELQSALSKGGWTFSGRVSERMIRMFDGDHSGSLQFMEFKKCFEFINQMSAGFKARDRDGSGTLEGHEVRTALQASGFQLQEGTFQIMMKKFDHEQQGGLKFDDYIELSIMLSTARNTFGFYDRQRTGQVTFNFDSFLTASLTMM